MVRDIILLIYTLGLAITSYVHTEISDTGLLIMINSITILIIISVIPEIFFKDSKMARILTKKII